MRSELSPPVVVEDDIDWSRLPADEHFVQLYPSDHALVGTMLKFASYGFRFGESVIMIATPAHLGPLNRRLTEEGFDLTVLRRLSRYVDLDASECLKGFMVDGRPDRERFRKTVGKLLSRAQIGGRRCRAFGEMVSVLWQRGNDSATLELERLWNEFRADIPFPLFCAYPRIGFTKETTESFAEICRAHTRIISDRRFPEGLDCSLLHRCV